MEKKKAKESIVAGALTGMAGIIITKALSLLYVIPFNAIAGDATVFYSYGYTVYDAMLQISLSGIPYAIATLVAKYSTKKDYSTVLLVKKVSRSLVLALGSVCCVLMLIFAKPLACQIIPTDLQSTDYVVKTVNVLRIVAFALIFVPFLSYFRGFYQGLKELKTYAFTQVFEQIVRIAFLLGASCLCVYAFKLDCVWAAYMGVVSTSISAITAIIYFLVYDKNYQLEGDITEPSIYSNKEIFFELVKVAIPYMLSALMLSSSGMYVLLMFSTGLERAGVDAKLITIYQGIINYQGSKLASIPQVFMTGFCLSIIPHITEAVTDMNDLKVKNLIEKVILTVNYLSIPVICLMVFFSKEIYYVMYGDYYLEVGTSLLAKLLITQLFANLFGVLESTLVAIQMRKAYLLLELTRLIFMCTIFTICLSTFGINGYFIAIIAEYILYIVSCLIIINNRYNLDFKAIFEKSSKSWIGCIPMFIIMVLVSHFTYSIMDNSRITILIITGILCAICGLGYLIITYCNGVITELFGFEITKDSINRLLSKFKKKGSEN